MLRRWSVMLAAITMLLLGSGALVALHELQHDLDRRTFTGDQRPATPHDDSNCAIHAMLHAPVLAGGIDLPSLGLAETAEKALPVREPVISTDCAASLSCRGPPML